MAVGNLTVEIDVDTHGALEDSKVGAVRRTLGLWAIMVAQVLLRSSIDINFKRAR